MGWMKRSARRLAQQVVTATGDTEWIQGEHEATSGPTLYRRKPLRFEDLDATVSFVIGLDRGQGVRLARAGSEGEVLRDTAQVRALIAARARAGRGSRSSFRVEVMADHRTLFDLTMRTEDDREGGTGAVTFMSLGGGGTRADLAQAAAQLDGVTTPLKRREVLAGQGVLTPDGAVDTSRKAHELKISAQSAVVGGLGGGALGFLGAIAGGFIAR